MYTYLNIHIYRFRMLCPKTCLNIRTMRPLVHQNLFAIYIPPHAHMHTCTHAHMHTCIHAYMHTCIHAHMHTCIHAYMHTCIKQFCASIHPANTLRQTCIHTYIRNMCFMPSACPKVSSPRWQSPKPGICPQIVCNFGPSQCIFAPSQCISRLHSAFRAFTVHFAPSQCIFTRVLCSFASTV